MSTIVCSYTSAHRHSHDEIAKYYGVPADPFDVMFPKEALQIKKKVLDYIGVLREAHSHNIGQASEETTNGFLRNAIRLDEFGFPKAPRPLDWSKVTKVELEPLFRMYIRSNYSKFLIRAETISRFSSFKLNCLRARMP